MLGARPKNCDGNTAMERIRSREVPHVGEAAVLAPSVEAQPEHDDEPTRRRTFGGEDEPTLVAAPGATKKQRSAQDDPCKEFDDLPRTNVMRSDVLKVLVERTRGDDAAASPLTAIASAPAPAASSMNQASGAEKQASAHVDKAAVRLPRVALLSMVALLAASLGVLKHFVPRWRWQRIAPATVPAMAPPLVLVRPDNQVPLASAPGAAPPSVSPPATVIVHARAATDDTNMSDARARPSRPASAPPRRH
jgi:hypothetical protein